MTLNNIWVFAQADGDTASTATLELLSKANTLGGSVTAFVAGLVDFCGTVIGERSGRATG